MHAFLCVFKKNFSLCFEGAFATCTRRIPHHNTIQIICNLYRINGQIKAGYKNRKGIVKH